MRSAVTTRSRHGDSKNDMLKTSTTNCGPIKAGGPSLRYIVKEEIPSPGTAMSKGSNGDLLELPELPISIA